MTQEAPKASPPPGKNKRHLPIVIYWSAYAALIVAAVAGSMFLGAIGFPTWAATVIAMVVIGVCVWFLEDSPVNPNRDLERDPFNRNFFVVNRQMVRAWGLRRRDVEWRETRSPDLPPYAVRVFKDLLGVDPEVSVEVDGLLWVAGERDWHGGFDPARFVVVAFDAEGKVQAADDLHAWPRRWRIPLSDIQGRWGG